MQGFLYRILMSGNIHTCHMIFFVLMQILKQFQGFSFLWLPDDNPKIPPANHCRIKSSTELCLKRAILLLQYVRSNELLEMYVVLWRNRNQLLLPRWMGKDKLIELGRWHLFLKKIVFNKNESDLSPYSYKMMVR